MSTPKLRPITRRSTRPVKSKHQRTESVVKIALSVLAVLLIAGGLATPQIVQAIEFQSRDSFVEDLLTLQDELTELRERNDATTILIGLQLRESERLSTEIKALADRHSDFIDAAQTAPLTQAVTEFASVQQELDRYNSNTLVINAVEKIQNVGQNDSANPNPEIQLMRAFSWYTANSESVREHFDVRPSDFAPLSEDLNKMTNFQFSEVKEQLSGTQRSLAAERTRAEELSVHKSKLLEAATTLVAPVMAYASETLNLLPPLEERALVFQYDLEELETLSEALHKTMSTKTFDYSTNGGLGPHPHPDNNIIGTTDDIGPGVHGLLIIRSLNEFLSAYASVDEEITAYEEEAAAIEAERRYLLELEQQRLYEEELRREQEAQQPVDPTPDPPVDETGTGDGGETPPEGEVPPEESPVDPGA